MGSGTLRAAVSLLLLVTLAAAWPSKDDTSVEGRLALWLLSKGAKLVRLRNSRSCCHARLQRCAGADGGLALHASMQGPDLPTDAATNCTRPTAAAPPSRTCVHAS